MPIGILDITLHLEGCQSLKEKRSRIAPILHQVHRKFNVSIAETDFQDVWQSALISIALVSNEKVHIEKSFQELLHFIESHWPDEEIASERIEIV